MRKNRVSLCLGTLIIALAGTSLAASIYTATGGITGNWEDTSSWASGALPGTADTAYLRYGDTLNANSTIAVNQVRISNSSTLNLLSGTDLSVGGGAGYTYVGYALSTSGNYNMSVATGAVLDTGRLYLGYNEGGTVTISGGSVTANERIFIGDRSGSTMATTQTGGTVTTVDADINFTESSANGTYALNGGTFQTGELTYRHKNLGTAVPVTMGGGTLKTSDIEYLATWGATDVTFSQAAGILDPAQVDASGVTSEIADLVISSSDDSANYTMGSGATLAMQISGTDAALEGAGGYDQISVDNVFTANGTLDVTFVDGYTATGGDSFDLLDAASFAGTFTTTNLPALPEGLLWDTDDLLTSGTLHITTESGPTPETIYSATGGITGNWTNTASWSGGVLPDSDDTAYLRYGDTINADSSVVVSQIRVANSSTLNLANGADVTVGGGSGYTYVGYHLTTSGNHNLTVSEGASLNTGRLYLGDNDGGTVTISGGSITANERIFIGNRAGSTMATTQAGGTVTTVAADINFSAATANGTYALNGGVFQAGELVYRYKSASTAIPFTMGGTGTLKTSGVKYLDTWGATDVTFIQASGTLDPALVDASGVTSEIADVVIYNNADTANYTMGASATLAMQISGTNSATEGAGGYDQVSVDDVFTVNGTLDVTFVDGYTATADDSFDLFDATSFAGTFTTVNLPALPEGLLWDTEDLLVDGHLHIVSDAPTTASAAILSISSFSNAVMVLEVSSDNPVLCYPKASVALTTNTAWSSVGHSSNGLPPFVVTNLTYSTASGTNFLIYVEVDQNKKFLTIGAE